MIKDDDTYVLNPTAGTYTGIVAIQVNGTAYNTSGTKPVYYVVNGANNQTYIDGSTSQQTNRYYLELTQNATIGFRKEIVGYNVSITGDSTRYGEWTITLTKTDNSTVSPSFGSITSDVVSIDITGVAYVHPSEGEGAWYLVRAGNTLYFNGES